MAISARAGLPVWIPDDVAGSCCGLPWGSKGFGDAHRHKANELVERLWEWSGEGGLPIVVDAASCTGQVVEPGEGTLSETNAARLGELQILDSVAWAHDRLLPELQILRKLDAAAIHPTCATNGQGNAPRLRALTAALADDVYQPSTTTCGGFAGDRGISPPRADRKRHPPGGGGATGPHLRRLPLKQPHLRDRHDPRHRPPLRIHHQRPGPRHPPVMLMGRKLDT